VRDTHGENAPEHLTYECKYVFDFIKRDWKEILHDYDFGNFAEHFYLRKYVRLLKAVKP
jgi:hypothetical protein